MPTSENSLQHDEKERGPFSMKDIRSTVMQLSGRWGNTSYATLCLPVEAALDLPYGDVQMKHWNTWWEKIVYAM